MSRTVQIVMPPLPGKAFVKQLPFINSDDGIFEVEFVEERRLGLEVNRFSNENSFSTLCCFRNLSTKLPDTRWYKESDVSTCS